MLRAVLLIVAAPAAMGFSIPQSIPTRRATVAKSLQMATQKAPEPKPGFESPKAKLNAIEANEKQWGITVEEGGDFEVTLGKGTATLKVEGGRAGQAWVPKDRTIKSKGKFPANLFNVEQPAVFNGGGWATTKATDETTLSQMKGSAIWIALGLLLIQPFTFMGTYQLQKSTYGLYEVVMGEPISMAKSKDTGEPVSCRQKYGVPCWPSGNPNDASWKTI